MNSTISSFLISDFMLILLGWLIIFCYALQSCFTVVYLSAQFFLYWPAVKAKTVGGVIKNRPPAGALDAALAAEYKVSMT